MHGDVYTVVEGNLGIVVLNRPSALNAFNVPMLEHIETHLERLHHDSTIAAIVIRGVGHRAFCAGGDIRSLYEAKKHGNPGPLDQLFRKEYRLNFDIAQYRKPYIAMIEGIAMGGGIGMSIYGSHRVVCETSLLAMPETAIGFFPDIGASYFLNQAPGALGMFLGLTGYRMGPQDALYAGWATHFVPQESFSVVMRELQQINSAQDVDAIFDRHSAVAGQSGLKAAQSLIDDCFSAPSVPEIMKRLRESQESLAKDWLAALAKRSPTSLMVTHALIQQNRGKSLKDCLACEFALSQRFMASREFHEGVRAVLVDKDQNPQWQPRCLDEITPEMVAAFLTPPDDLIPLFAPETVRDHL